MSIKCPKSQLIENDQNPTVTLQRMAESLISEVRFWSLTHTNSFLSQEDPVGHLGKIMSSHQEFHCLR